MTTKPDPGTLAYWQCEACGRPLDGAIELEQGYCQEHSCVGCGDALGEPDWRGEHWCGPCAAEQQRRETAETLAEWRYQR